MEVIDIRCPGCGAPCSVRQKDCEFCGRALVVSSFSSLAGLGPSDLRKYTQSYQARVGAEQDPGLYAALGIVCLKMGLFDEANGAFESAMREGVENSEVLFYAAASQLGGKRPFLCSLAHVRRAETLLVAALRLETRGAYYLVLAYLAYDYYERKFLNHEPSYVELLAQSVAAGLSEDDYELVLAVLGAERLDFPTSMFEQIERPGI